MHFVKLVENDSRWPVGSMDRLVEECEDRGMLVDVANGQVVMTPPLISSQAECEEMVSILREAISATSSPSGS
jgi:adenosylmethionine-8-amino-7-oxononanoate aminotransferase